MELHSDASSLKRRVTGLIAVGYQSFSPAMRGARGAQALAACADRPRSRRHDQPMHQNPGCGCSGVRYGNLPLFQRICSLALGPRQLAVEPLIMGFYRNSTSRTPSDSVFYVCLEAQRDEHTLLEVFGGICFVVLTLESRKKGDKFFPSLNLCWRVVQFGPSKNRLFLTPTKCPSKRG
jgi:hypothetical protein